MQGTSSVRFLCSFNFVGITLSWIPPDGSWSIVMMKADTVMEEIMKSDNYNRGPICQFCNPGNLYFDLQ
jgi:hypothetical protein